MTTKIPKTTMNLTKRYKTLSRPEIFDKFAHWMAFPPSLRTPRFQKDFAKQYEVSPDTLSDYKKLTYFWDAFKKYESTIQSEIYEQELMRKIYDKYKQNTLEK